MRRGASLGCSAVCALWVLSCQPYWQNYLRDYQTEGQRFRPGSAAEVLEIVREVAKSGGKVRAVGSGHSSSDVARPASGSAWIEVGRIDEVEAWDSYRAPVSGQEDPSERYVRVGAGARIEEINQLLAARGRALYNMGNYDGQTIAGAFSTGTHGSGIRHGLLGDRIVAIELVTDEKDPVTGARMQRLLRLEPKDGVTDPERFARRAQGSAPPMTLEQDDAAFRAALINFGTFGIIVSVTIDTRKAFFLEESERVGFWDEAPPSLEELARENPEFLMVQVEPHALQKGPVGHVPYVKTVRREVRPCDARVRRRPPSAEDLGRFIGHVFGTQNLELFSLNHAPLATKAVYDGFLLRQNRTRPFSSRSDVVHINSLGPYVTATSVDIWVPLAFGTEAVNRIVEIAAERGTLEPLSEVPLEKQWRHTSPLGIRVVGQSRALLSPSYDGPRISIEIPLLVGFAPEKKAPGKTPERGLTPEEYRRQGNAYRMRMLRELTAELLGPDYAGRPHWGQMNFSTVEFVAREYGRNWDCWVSQFRRFNAYGTFDNSFTKRMCLSSDGVNCESAPVHPAAGACQGIGE